MPNVIGFLERGSLYLGFFRCRLQLLVPVGGYPRGVASATGGIIVTTRTCHDRHTELRREEPRLAFVHVRQLIANAPQTRSNPAATTLESASKRRAVSRSRAKASAGVVEVLHD